MTKDTGQLIGCWALAVARPQESACCDLCRKQISRGRLEIQQGSLYPALYRLEHQGWIASEWGESDNKRKAKYYRLTPAGRRQLRSEAEKWSQMAGLMANILSTTPEQV